MDSLHQFFRDPAAIADFGGNTMAEEHQVKLREMILYATLHRMASMQCRGEGPLRSVATVALHVSLYLGKRYGREYGEDPDSTMLSIRRHLAQDNAVVGMLNGLPAGVILPDAKAGLVYERPKGLHAQAPSVIDPGWLADQFDALYKELEAKGHSSEISALGSSTMSRAKSLHWHQILIAARFIPVGGNTAMLGNHLERGGRYRLQCFNGT